MPQPRKNIISLGDTSFYHCMSRCVRRAFLCGIDHYSGVNYEHRRDWLEDKLHQTADAFAIKLCAYAVMHNHYHVVLNVRSDLALSWSRQEVVERWHRLFSGTPLSQRFAEGVMLKKSQKRILNKDISLWRERLMDISWFMRVVNEAIARQANTEDNCTGRFWEGRFKSQALLDDKALLACMAYVDLNPVRAGLATSPKTSDHTCVRQRISARVTHSPMPGCIEEFIGNLSGESGLPFSLKEYLEVVDWTGRLIKEKERDDNMANVPPILNYFGLKSAAWKTLTTQFELQFRQWVGSESIVKQLYRDKHYQRLPSTHAHRSLFG